MSDWIAGLLVSACVFAGGVSGMLLYRVLPAGHQTTETRDNIRLAIGMISILASLVLGLLTASAKQTFDSADSQLRSFAADIIILDQTLRQFGPEAAPARAELHAYTARAVETTWPEHPLTEPLPLEDVEAEKHLDRVTQLTLNLKPADDDQRMFRSQAITLVDQLVRARWTLLVNQSGALSPVLLIIMVIWISMIFLSFGLFAPHNTTVLIAFFICSLSIGTSIFLILEMDTPFDGVIMVSGNAMRSALGHLTP